MDGRWQMFLKFRKGLGSSNFHPLYLQKYPNWGFIGTYPFVEGSKKFDVRLEVFSCLFESLVI